MNLPLCLRRLRRSRIFRCGAVALVLSLSAFGGEIHDAAQNGDLAQVKALLKDNPDLVFSIDSNGDTPLHMAARYGHKEVAELLLVYKADVNAEDYANWTPMQMAKFNYHDDMVELLLANNAKTFTPHFRWDLIVAAVCALVLFFISTTKSKKPRWCIVGLRLMGIYLLLFAVLGSLQDGFVDPALNSRMLQLKNIFGGAFLSLAIFGAVFIKEIRKYTNKQPAKI